MNHRESGDAPDGTPEQSTPEQPVSERSPEQLPSDRQAQDEGATAEWAATTELPADEWAATTQLPEADTAADSESPTEALPATDAGPPPGGTTAPPPGPGAPPSAVWGAQGNGADEPGPATPTSPSPTGGYVRAVFGPQGLVTTAWIVAVPLVLGLVSAACLLGALGATTGEMPDFATAAAAILVALGLVLGGGVSARGDIDAGFFSASGSAAITVFALGTLVAVSATTVLVAKLRARREAAGPSTVAELARAAIEAGFAGILILLLTVFASLGDAAGLSGLVIRSRAPLALLVVFLVVGFTLFLTRESARRRALGLPDGRWARPFREAVRYFGVQFALFGLVALVGAVVIAVRAESIGAFFALLPFLGNVAGIAAALGHLGGVTAASGFTGTEMGFAWNLLGWHSAWLIAAAVIGIVVGAVFVGARRPYATHPQMRRPDWKRIWQLPLVVFAIWCVLALGVLGARASGQLSSMMDLVGAGSVGLAWYVPFAMAIAAAATSLLAEFAPLWLARVNPAWAAALAAPVAGVPFASAETVPQATAPHTTPGQGFAPPAGFAAAAPGAAPAGPAPAPQPMSRKAKGTLIAVLASVVGVGVLIGATAITVAVLNGQRDPATAVDDYLSLLEDGKAEAATELVDPGLQNADRELLTDEVMAGAIHRIEVVDVTTENRSEGTATVTATLSLDGERFEHTFPVVEGDKELLFLDTWELREPLLVPVTLESDGAETITVGDAEVQLESSGDSGFWGGSYPTRELMVYPGVYPVGGVENEFVTTSEEELRALPGNGEWASVAVESAPNQAFEAAILEQVQARITQCTEVPTNMDDECPYLTQDDDLDELTVVSQAEGFDEISLTDFVASEAEIAVRANPSTFDEDPDLEETSFTASGEIEIIDGKPTVTEISLGGGFWW